MAFGIHFKTKILVFPGFPKEVVNHYHPIELPNMWRGTIKFHIIQRRNYDYPHLNKSNYLEELTWKSNIASKNII